MPKMEIFRSEKTAFFEQFYGNGCSTANFYPIDLKPLASCRKLSELTFGSFPDFRRPLSADKGIAFAQLPGFHTFQEVTPNPHLELTLEVFLELV